MIGRRLSNSNPGCLTLENALFWHPGVGSQRWNSGTEEKEENWKYTLMFVSLILSILSQVHSLCGIQCYCELKLGFDVLKLYSSTQLHFPLKKNQTAFFLCLCFSKLLLFQSRPSKVTEKLTCRFQDGLCPL
jgi:hypothetical protein